MEQKDAGRLAKVRDFANYCAPLLALVPCVIWLLVWMLPVLTETGFNGVWLKRTGYHFMPDVMRLQVSNGKFKETFPVRYSGEYEIVTLVLDGHDHAWTGGGFFEGWMGTTYSAQLNKGTLSVIKRKNEGPYQEVAILEQWTLQEGSHELVISSPSSETVYVHAPWYRALFVSDP